MIKELINRFTIRAVLFPNLWKFGISCGNFQLDDGSLAFAFVFDLGAGGIVIGYLK